MLFIMLKIWIALGILAALVHYFMALWLVHDGEITREQFNDEDLPICFILLALGPISVALVLQAIYVGWKESNEDNNDDL